MRSPKWLESAEEIAWRPCRNHLVAFKAKPGGLFRILRNGNTLLDNFHIYKEAGSLQALAKTLFHLRPCPQDILNITLDST